MINNNKILIFHKKQFNYDWFAFDNILSNKLDLTSPRTYQHRFQDHRILIHLLIETETSMITRQSIFFTILSMIKKASVISNYFKITKGTVIKPTKIFEINLISSLNLTFFLLQTFKTDF